jgi:hypothetical protein
LSLLESVVAKQKRNIRFYTPVAPIIGINVTGTLGTKNRDSTDGGNVMHDDDESTVRIEEEEMEEEEEQGDDVMVSQSESDGYEGGVLLDSFSQEMESMADELEDST